MYEAIFLLFLPQMQVFKDDFEKERDGRNNSLQKLKDVMTQVSMQYLQNCCVLFIKYYSSLHIELIYGYETPLPPDMILQGYVLNVMW